MLICCSLISQFKLASHMTHSSMERLISLVKCSHQPTTSVARMRQPFLERCLAKIETLRHLHLKRVLVHCDILHRFGSPSWFPVCNACHFTNKDRFPEFRIKKRKISLW